MSPNNLGRRESLGRNRQGPATRGTMTYVVIGGAVIVGLAVFAYTYLTKPERVFGANQLKCAATEITWSVNDAGRTVVRGCGKSADAICDEHRCRAADEPDGANF